ncbi:MAG: argininosuccinate lyase [Planctomycetes bacterium]|nr:argininosuccinate lyase [Planctomycetota bacterium]
MPRLWEKGVRVDPIVHAFCTGEDPQLDGRLVEAEVYGSIAHAAGLARIGVLTKAEYGRLHGALVSLLGRWRSGSFAVRPADEDVHTAVENHLTERLGPVGKKIHAGRSRNDQVQVDLRLFGREALLRIEELLLRAAGSLATVAARFEDCPVPGYTHTRRGMPSSIGLWAGAYAEGFLDDRRLLLAALDLVDQCPLGSAAGYGVPLPLDREYVARLLGFPKVQANTLAVQNSRGKLESAALQACAMILLDAGRLAGDLILFSTEEFGFVRLPEELCTGSSIMPNKKNPDALELIRGSGAEVAAQAAATWQMTAKLPAGYQRDLQLTKGPFLRGLERTASCLLVLDLCLRRLEVDRDRCLAACSSEIFAADRALDWVRTGVPFRTAYRRVADELRHAPESGARPATRAEALANLRSKRHTGGPGNLGLARLGRELRAAERDRVRRARRADLRALLQARTPPRG